MSNSLLAMRTNRTREKTGDPKTQRFRASYDMMRLPSTGTFRWLQSSKKYRLYRRQLTRLIVSCLAMASFGGGSPIPHDIQYVLRTRTRIWCIPDGGNLSDHNKIISTRNTRYYRVAEQRYSAPTQGALEVGWIRILRVNSLRSTRTSLNPTTFCTSRGHRYISFWPSIRVLVLSRIGLSIPTTRLFSSTLAKSRFGAFA